MRPIETPPPTGRHEERTNDVRMFSAVTGLVAMLSLTLIVSSAGAAQPVFGYHAGPVTNGPFPLSWCDEVEGTAVTRSVVQVRQDANGTFIQNARSTVVFTATATGRSVEYSEAGVVKSGVIDNADGTTTYVSKGAGLDRVFKIANGPVLKSESGEPLRSAGESDSAVTFDTSTGELISFTQSIHGPHPDEDDDVCGPTVAYLQGP
jgi:hypothetical protein